MPSAHPNPNRHLFFLDINYIFSCITSDNHIQPLCRCAKEMNQWETLLEYANSRGNVIPELILECAWRTPNWPLMKDALSRVSSWHCTVRWAFLTFCLRIYRPGWISMFFGDYENQFEFFLLSGFISDLWQLFKL